MQNFSFSFKCADHSEVSMAPDVQVTRSLFAIKFSTSTLPNSYIKKRKTQDNCSLMFLLPIKLLRIIASIPMLQYFALVPLKSTA